jgi:hypothetical protein
MYATGTIAGTKIVAGSITATQIQAESIDTTRLVANNINADRLLAGTITSDSGKIGALSVKSLSIGDNAATVPVAQATGGNVNGGAGGTVSYFSFDLTIDTTGLAGKNIPVYADVSAQWENSSGANAASSFWLNMNGSVVNSFFVSIGNGQIFLLSHTGVINITGNGGVMSIPIQANFNGSSLTHIVAGATIFAMAAKR